MSFPDQSCDDWMSCCTWLVVERDKFKERSYKTILRPDLLQYLLYVFFQYEHTYRIPEHYDLGFRTNPKSRAKSRNKDMMTPGKNGQKIHGVTVFLFLGPCNLNQ